MVSSQKTGGEKHRDALLLIDVINDFDFHGARKMLPQAEEAARKIAALKIRAARVRVPTIYVNDNFGRWRSDFRSQVEYCLRKESRGKEITRLLHPKEEDFFVLKPMHSGFYSTTLGVLLEQLGIRRLILCGFATDLCVVYTANDAYMRGYEIAVPPDCTSAATKARYRFTIEHMEGRLKADMRKSSSIRFRNHRRS